MNEARGGIYTNTWGGGGEKGRTVLGLANFLCRNYKEG